jgi:hypothetical protein
VEKEEKAINNYVNAGGLFASAIYYTAQSMFQPELAQHAHELYEKVNRAHWGLDKAKSILFFITIFIFTVRMRERGAEKWAKGKGEKGEEESILLPLWFG